MNFATLTLSQTGATVTGTMAGYGGNFQGNVVGTVNGATLHLNLDAVVPWGTFTFYIDNNNTLFGTGSIGLGMCGVKTGPLPPGCGFSGKWCLTSATHIVPDNSYADLTQDGILVNGTIYADNGRALGSITGAVTWGKGYGISNVMVGKTMLTLWMDTPDSSFHSFQLHVLDGTRETGNGCGP